MGHLNSLRRPWRDSVLHSGATSCPVRWLRGSGESQQFPDKEHFARPRPRTILLVRIVETMIGKTEVELTLHEEQRPSAWAKGEIQRVLFLFFNLKKLILFEYT